MRIVIKAILLFGIALCNITYASELSDEPMLHVQYTAYTYMVPESKLTSTWESVFGKTLKIITTTDNNAPQVFIVKNDILPVLDKKLNGLFADNGTVNTIRTQCYLSETCGGGSSTATSPQSSGLGNTKNSETLVQKSIIKFTKASNSKSNLVIKMSYSYTGLVPENTIKNLKQELISLHFIKKILVNPGYSHIVIIGTKKNGMVFGQVMLVSLKAIPQ